MKSFSLGRLRAPGNKDICHTTAQIKKKMGFIAYIDDVALCFILKMPVANFGEE